MYRYLKQHEALVESMLARGAEHQDWAGLARFHRTQIGYMQHERLIHLLVTLAFGLFGLLTLLASVAFPRTELTLLLLLFLALLLPYVAHYFRLENGVQRWYRLANEIERRAGTFPQVDRGPAGAGPERPAG
jgi:hypothetical protein